MGGQGSQDFKRTAKTPDVQADLRIHYAHMQFYREYYAPAPFRINFPPLKFLSLTLPDSKVPSGSSLIHTVLCLSLEELKELQKWVIT